MTACSRQIIAVVVVVATLVGGAPFALAQDFRPIVPCRDLPSTSTAYDDGVFDLYTAILCFVQDDRCGCLSAMETPEIDGDLSDDCVSRRPDAAAFGVVTGSSELQCGGAAPGPFNVDALLTCREYDDFPTDDGFLSSAREAYRIGAVDFLAGLLCFARDRRCECLQSVELERRAELRRRVADEIEACLARDAGESAIGAPVRAALDMCRGECGDGFRDEDLGEACDGDDLGGSTCGSLGFPGGQLGCGSGCAFDTSRCLSCLGEGESCDFDSDCCVEPDTAGSICDRGRCAVVGGSCVPLGAPCSDADIGNCCTGRCCGVSSGGGFDGICDTCRLLGESCSQDSDCCANTGRPGDIVLCSGGSCELIGFAVIIGQCDGMGP